MKPLEHGGVRLLCDIHILVSRPATGLWDWWVCADLLKVLCILRLATVYAHWLTFNVPRLLSPLCLTLHFFTFCFFSTDFWSPFPVFFFFCYPILSQFSFFFTHWHVLTSLSLYLSLQCISHITSLLLHRQPSLQQPALKLMAESGDEALLQLTLDQINMMTAVSVISQHSNAPTSPETIIICYPKWSL